MPSNAAMHNQNKYHDQIPESCSSNPRSATHLFHFAHVPYNAHSSLTVPLIMLIPSRSCSAKPMLACHPVEIPSVTMYHSILKVLSK